MNAATPWREFRREIPPHRSNPLDKGSSKEPSTALRRCEVGAKITRAPGKLMLQRTAITGIIVLLGAFTVSARAADIAPEDLEPRFHDMVRPFL